MNSGQGTATELVDAARHPGREASGDHQLVRPAIAVLQFQAEVFVPLRQSGPTLRAYRRIGITSPLV